MRADASNEQVLSLWLVCEVDDHNKSGNSFGGCEMKALDGQEHLAMGMQDATHSKKQDNKQQADSGIAYWIATITLTLVAWLLGDKELYTADSALGYNLGLTGGILMLMLLLYPLRKRIGFMRAWIPLKYWFMAHMFLGVAGPMFIMFHCNLRFDSINGSVAFWSMTAVFLSGLVGRFIYTKIHYGLYGQRATLEEMKADLGMHTDDAREGARFSATVENKLRYFEATALNASTGMASVWRLITLTPWSYWVYLRTQYLVKREIKQQGRTQGWDKTQVHKHLDEGRSAIRNYLRTILKVVQFNIYESLFSLWHILHVPLMFILLVSGIVHVLAVHMY